MKGRGYSSESDLANRLKLCYTYDDLSRVIKREAISLDNNNNLISSESFNYNPAGNITIGMDESVVYDTNNRIVEYQGTEVTYDADGNMLISPIGEFTYDSANRLTVADTTIYTYDVENIRTKKCIGETITEYTHNANSKLSQLLMKTENGVTTYYIYGLGLIYETTDTDCKVYHYDYRGSTVALTDETGSVTDRFSYDTYGKLTSRTGTSSTPFLYNGRDGVMTDENGLVYMRARYYSPTFKRFINADVVAGSITNAITLNRYAYANGNPVSNVDPFGLCARDTKPHLYDQDGGIIYPKGWSKSLKFKQTNITINGDEFNKISSYTSADDAAIAFALETYNATMYLRFEYSCVIYELNGRYYYDNLQLEYPHSCLDINTSVPDGAEYIGYAHTHPNSLVFSEPDKNYAKYKKGDAYVVVPGGKLFRFNYDNETTEEVAIDRDSKWKQLTDSDEILLVNESRERWTSHLEEGCKFNCNEKNLEWPNTDYEGR